MANAGHAFPEVHPTLFQSVGFVLLSVYLISNLANDIALNTLGSKAYLSLIVGAALPLFLLLSGHPLLACRHIIGRGAVVLLLCMAGATAFSIWHGGSARLLRDFFLKNYLMLFYFPAFALTLRQCEWLFRVCILAGIVVLISCFAFGSISSGRLMIPESIFFDNANDLALQLVISGCFMTFLLRSPRLTVKVCGGALLAITGWFLLRTASRAGFVALLVCVGVALLTVRHRLRLVLCFLPACVLAIALVPSQQWDRLLSIIVAPDQVGFDEEAVMSQMERTDMLRRSLALTASHPFFGVGTGMFAEEVRLDAAIEQKRVPFLQTHNSYTQVSSENGIPALLAYLIILLAAMRGAFQLYKTASHRPELERLTGMAHSLFLALVGYAVTSAFHHVAYSRQLPILAGLSMALWFVSRPLLGSPRPAAPAASSPPRVAEWPALQPGPL